jgi:hypothetical protein
MQSQLKVRFLIPVSLLFLLPHPGSADWSKRSIYGEDNRQEWWDVREEMQIRAGEATGALFAKEQVFPVDSRTIQLPQKSMIEEYGACRDERFSEQPVGANCSGLLVGPDLFLTAQHCIPNQRECQKNLIVFGYEMDPNRASHRLVDKAQVYQCIEVVQQNRSLDFSLIRLERPVSDRRPIEIREDSPEPEKNEELFMVGHPLGLPRKLTDQGRVWGKSRNNFVSDLDAFGGNSGSPIFRAKDGQLMGILIEGAEDFISSEESNGCRRPKRCHSNSCEGETAVLASSIAKKLRQR